MVISICFHNLSTEQICAFVFHKQEIITDSEDCCSRFRGLLESGEETGEDTETAVPSTVDSIGFLAGLESLAFPLTAL